MAEQDDLWAVVVHEDGSKSIVMNDGDLATIATNLQADRDRWRDEAHRLMAELEKSNRAATVVRNQEEETA